MSNVALTLTLTLTLTLMYNEGIEHFYNRCVPTSLKQVMELRAVGHVVHIILQKESWKHEAPKKVDK